MMHVVIFLHATIPSGGISKRFFRLCFRWFQDSHCHVTMVVLLPYSSYNNKQKDTQSVLDFIRRNQYDLLQVHIIIFWLSAKSTHSRILNSHDDIHDPRFHNPQPPTTTTTTATTQEYTKHSTASLFAKRIQQQNNNCSCKRPHKILPQSHDTDKNHQYDMLCAYFAVVHNYFVFS